MSDDATPTEPDHDDAESLLRPSAEEKRTQETVMLNRENIDELMAAARSAAGGDVAGQAAQGDGPSSSSASPADAAASAGGEEKRSSSAIFIFVGLAIVVVIALLVLVAR